MLQRSMLVLAVALCASGASIAHAQDTSTPEERQHWAEVSHRLEADPLNADLNREAAGVLKRVIEVKDVHIVVCADAFEQMHGVGKEFRNESTMLFMLGDAAFVVQHPDQSANVPGVNLAGLESVVNAYRLILTQSPHDHDKVLDRLLEAQKNGTLATEVQGKCANAPSPAAAN